MPRAKAPAPKTETVERIDPDEDFSDVDGDLRAEFALSDEAPDRHYVWVHNKPETVGEYKGNLLGYKVEHAEADGVHPTMLYETQPGEAITRRDHVLMSCDRARFEKRERFERMKNKEMRTAFIRKAGDNANMLNYRNPED
jgi:hypothetical protein